MVQIVPPIGIVQKVMGAQRMNEGTAYRLTTHHLAIEQPEGVLLYHTLTGELLLLSREEMALLGSLPGTIPAALAKLGPSRFLVPDGADEMALADQTRDIIRRLGGNNVPLTEYMIFTTTACNARCFYCFEAGIKKATMTEDAARAAGEYIANHCGGRPVHLVWFGGEPLVNVQAIDTIAGVLHRRGVEFTSRITTNGYLFDEATAARAKADWGVNEAQITLDGTEEIYNARKAYVHPAGSPFQRVLRNIGLLLDAGVPVRVRLNMDEDNERDLYALVDQLAERFGGNPGFCVALRMIIENKGTRPHSYTEEERQTLGEKAQEMWEYLDRKGMAWKRHLQRGPVLYSCRASNVGAATITPEGRLGRCESHIDKGLWGSVFSDERDEQVLRQWREYRPPVEHCRSCELYPLCVRLKECVIHAEHCSPIERAENRIWLRRSMLATFEEWKVEHPGEL